MVTAREREQQKRLLAFAHIGKTGGTTLIHLLRKNYFMRYCDVEPFCAESGKLLTASDLRKTLRINPFLQCVAGHSVRPYSNLKQVFPQLQYITLLRDPVARCISQYQQRVKKHGNISFEEFLTRPWLPNLQTRFIAGSEDLEKAKAILQRDFLVVGVLEQFDEFMALLAAKLSLPHFDPSYVSRRVAKDQSQKAQLVQRYRADIEAIHQLDFALYDFVKTQWFPQHVSDCSSTFERYLRLIRATKDQLKPAHDTRAYLDYMVRKAYYLPAQEVVKLAGNLKL